MASGAELHLQMESEDETLQVASCLAWHLRAGDLIGLEGDLGAGKTTFVRGLARGLGIDPGRVRSPTFTLINEYGGGTLALFHLDLYRLDPTAVDRLALREYLYGDGVCAVEWIERLGEDPPRLSVSLVYVGEQERTLVVRAVGVRYERLVVPEVWGRTAEGKD